MPEYRDPWVTNLAALMAGASPDDSRIGLATADMEGGRRAIVNELMRKKYTPQGLINEDGSPAAPGRSDIANALMSLRDYIPENPNAVGGSESTGHPLNVLNWSFPNMLRGSLDNAANTFDRAGGYLDPSGMTAFDVPMMGPGYLAVAAPRNALGAFGGRLVHGGNELDALIAKLRDAHDKWGAVPDEWYVHGRHGSGALRDDAVIQMTRDFNVMDQYAGRSGSGWGIRPKSSANIWDSGRDMEPLVRAAQTDFRRGRLPFLEDIEGSIGRRATPDDVSMAIRESFAPDNIVDSARAFDNGDWVRWFYDTTKADLAKTPDGAVGLNLDALDTVRLFDRSRR